MEYVIKHIGDICKKVCSGGTPTSSNLSYYEGGTIPWLNTNEVNFCNIYDTNKKITEEGLNNSAAKYIPENSVIVAMYGVTAGKSAIAKIPLTTNQACCNLIIDESQADYRFVYYFLQQQCDNLNKLANGGAQQNLNALIIKKFKISLPPLPAQRKIASILSSYDFLIENNTKRIRILEQMAENLYKEWFVRFRFPGHENTEFVDGLPKGWKIEKYSSFVEIMSGGTPNTDNSSYYGGHIPFFTPKDSKAGVFVYDTLTTITEEGLRHCNSQLYPKDTLIITARGTVGKLNLLAEPMAMNQSCFALKSTILDAPYYLYYATNNAVNKLKKMANGGVFDTIIIKTFDHIKLTMPPIDIIKSYEYKVKPIMIQIQSLQRQSALLIRQRDLLLPRLMSGKLEVKS